VAAFASTGTDPVAAFASTGTDPVAAFAPMGTDLMATITGICDEVFFLILEKAIE